MDTSEFALGALITIIPFYLGLTVFRVSFARMHARPMVALAVGMSLYFLFDGFNDSAQLGVTQGLPGGPQQLVLVGAFAVTFTILVFARPTPEGTWPLWIVGVGISIHSLSEASEVSSTVALYFANLSGVTPTALTFIIHKFLEGTVLVAAAVASGTSSFRRVLVAGVPMVILALAGSLLGVLSSLELSPFIAAGVGGWMFVTVGFALHLDRHGKPSVLLLVLAGFIIVYSGALFHYTTFV